MWRTLQGKFPVDSDYPPRVARLAALQRVLNGTLYDVLRHAAHDEMDGSGQYIKLRDRRPGVRYNLCKLAVRKAVGMLFSEGHFPEIEHPDDATKQALGQIARDAGLQLAMVDAATRGSIGSVAIWLRVLTGRIYVDVLDTLFLAPSYSPERPDELVAVTERRKMTGAELGAMGYAIDPKDAQAPHWWQRVWTADAEEWYRPQKINGKDELTRPVLDVGKTIEHGLGFVPMVWIRNLPGGNGVDGAPTFDDEAIETQIEIEYQLSQGARALRYAGDPLLLIKEPATDAGGSFVRSASNAMVVGKDGDAKLVEIDGAASEAVIGFSKYLADLAREQLHTPALNPDKMSAAQSGRALELLMGPLIELADQLRTTYGTEGVQRLLQMVVRVGSESQLIGADGKPYPTLTDGAVTLKWPAWFAPTPQDLSQIATTLRIHTDAGHMSQASAVGIVAPLYDIPDAQAELLAIESDEAKRAAAAPQVIEKINV